MKILIVDDNAAVRRLIASLVLPLANRICECEDGAGALSAYQDQKPDLVLMDIRMPQLDGISATKQIIAADPAARIVIVTDYDDESLRQAAMNAGAFGFALKDDLMALTRLVESPQNPR